MFFFSNPEFLYVLFLCVHIKGEQLNNLFCEAVGYLEWYGFRVLALGFGRLATVLRFTIYKLKYINSLILTLRWSTD